MDALGALVRDFADAHPEEVARRIEGLDPREGAAVLRALPTAAAAGVLRRTAPARGADVLGRIEPERSREILGHMPLLAGSALLLPMEPATREALMGGLPESTAQRLQQQMAYAPETAGGIMRPHALSLPIDLSVQGAISAIRRSGRETVYYLYVTDREGKLAGVLSKRALLLAGPREPIEGLVERDIVSVPPHLDREEVARIMDQRRLYALPVAGPDGRLLGVVSHEEAMEAVQEEAFEDLQRMSGAGGDERALSSPRVVVRKRLPWLTLNLGTAFLAAGVVGLFQDVIGAVTALAVLMPVVSAVSGNAGVQALSVVMRGLALREIAVGNRSRVVLKELAGGFLNGLWAALLAGLVTWLWFGVPGLGLVIAAAMVVNMVSAGLLGATIPLALRALGRDPAQSSSIFLTTLTDIVGFGSFLTLARLFLPLLG
jgi:magnesium transporter